SLLQNGKGLPAYVAKAESELEKVQSELDNARNDSRNAEAYFNFLLNRPLEDSIEISPETAPLSTPKFTDLDTPDRREELNSLAILSKIDSLSYRMDKAYRSPKLNAFLDLGAQNFQFRVDNKSFFYLTGLQLDIPIFSGKRNLYKIDQAALDARTVSLQRQDTRNQLQLAILVSRNAVVNAWNTYESALKQESSAGKYFRLVNLGYAQGVNSFLEFLDARTTYTNARLLSNIDHYKVLIALADYERQTSSYQFN
ncbi:MAG: TolC family protein, partial [Bacteroidota bacterium]|nr:TolC family protein [Bacteroidota bacterium]